MGAFREGEKGGLGCVRADGLYVRFQWLLESGGRGVCRDVGQIELGVFEKS